jgi:hypothetical protein
MPSHYNDFFLDDNQDWEPILWKRDQNEIKPKNENIIHEIEFNRLLISARQKAQFTPNKLSQALGIPLKELEKYEIGSKLPEKNILARINKLLSSKLVIPKK